MSLKMQQLGNIIEVDPAVDNVYYWMGANPTVSQGRVMINLKAFGQRKDSAAQYQYTLQDPDIKNLIIGQAY